MEIQDKDLNRTETETVFPTSAAATERGIAAVVRMEKRNQEARNRIGQISDTITDIAGSGPAIVIHALWFALWLFINLNLIPLIPAFDPFPFSFLTMIVSLEAIFLTLFVLVSQNRMSEEADKRARLDLQINILAERESTMILRMLNEISKQLHLEGRARSDLEELLKDTQVDEIAKKLDEALRSK